MAAARRFAAALLAPLLAVSVAGCLGDDRCRLAADGTSECGVLLGITTASPTTDALAAAERFAGRPYDLVYRFHGIDEEIPTTDERAVVESGRALHLSIDTHVADSRAGLTWRAVAAGTYDALLRRQARGVAGLGKPVFVTYEHEMDQAFKSSLGTPKDFVAAWRHVHDLYEEEGAGNAVWVWVASGTTETIPVAREMWPGDDVVDWISWDVYNASGCRFDGTDVSRWSSFADELDVFYTWLRREGPAAGIDIRKPLMISEMGSIVYPDAPSRTADWYAEVSAVLEKRPEIRAVGLWDHLGNRSCDYRFTGVEPLGPAIRDLAGSPIFAQLAVTD